MSEGLEWLGFAKSEIETIYDEDEMLDLESEWFDIDTQAADYPD